MVVMVLPLLLLLYILATWDTSTNGIFRQKRIGQFGKTFTIFKFRTIHPKTLTISPFGQFLRTYKLDELPQLFNIIKGEMSFVGPRPDIPGYYDQLKGEDRKILTLKPGLTSEASIKYRNEADILKNQENPDEYNDEVIFPDKIKINADYLQKISLKTDLMIILKTIKSIFQNKDNTI